MIKGVIGVTAEVITRCAMPKRMAARIMATHILRCVGFPSSVFLILINFSDFITILLLAGICIFWRNPYGGSMNIS